MQGSDWNMSAGVLDNGCVDRFHRLILVGVLVAGVFSALFAPVHAQTQPGGRPAPAAPAQTLPVRDGQVFQDWTARCERIQGRPQERCFLSQTQATPEGQRLVQLNFGYLGPKQEFAGVVYLPLGIYLPAGAAYRIDEGPQVPIQFESCLAEGCRAGFLIDEATLRLLRNGQNIRFGFLSEPNGASLLIAVPLRGFSAGFGGLRP
jgi:invasion protein IalB